MAGNVFVNVPNVPLLWLVEGMAEYLSVGRNDPHTAMWMRSAVLRDKVPKYKDLTDPNIFPYRYGQALCAYIGGRWGDDVLVDLFLEGLRRPLEDAIQRQLQLSPDRLVADLSSAVSTIKTGLQTAKGVEMARPRHEDPLAGRDAEVREDLQQRLRVRFRPRDVERRDHQVGGNPFGGDCAQPGQRFEQIFAGTFGKLLAAFDVRGVGQVAIRQHMVAGQNGEGLAADTALRQLQHHRGGLVVWRV